MTALATSSVTLGYHGHAVVHEATVTLAPGRVTALVGPNGSGKSTLLRALARLHAPDEGRSGSPTAARCGRSARRSSPARSPC